jgi:hypothetical protein
MVQALVQRELFTAGAPADTVYNAGAPGNLGVVVTGNLLSRSIGPLVSPTVAPGYSADLRRTKLETYIDLTGSPVPTGHYGGWWFLTPGTVYDGVNKPSLMWLRTAANLAIMELRFNPSTMKLARNCVSQGQAEFTSGPTLSYYTWYWLSMAWNQHASLIDWKFFYMPLGGSLTALETQTNVANTRTLDRVGLMNGIQGASTSVLDGRVGAPSLYSLGALADAAYPSDLTQPVVQRYSHYFNPTTGSDSNDGLTAGTPRQTAAKLAEMGNYAGFLGSPTPWVYAADGTTVPVGLDAQLFAAGCKSGAIVPGGDVVILDTSGGPLYCDQQVTLGVNCDGVELKSANVAAADLRGFKVLSGWTQYDAVNYPKVWKVADAQMFDTGTVNITPAVWESYTAGARRWLNHPTYTRNATIATLAPTLNANPGSCFSDATNTYISTIDGSNPNTNGYVYERATLYSSTYGGTVNGTGSILSWSAGNVCIRNVSSAGSSCLDNLNGSNGYNAYCLNGSDNGNGVGGTAVFGARSFIDSCYGSHYGKHAFGILGGTGGAINVMYNLDMERGHPQLLGGGQTAYVSFSNRIVADTVHIYDSCRCTYNSGVLYSTDGVTLLTNPVFLTHNGGTANPAYTLLLLVDCDFGTQGVINQSNVTATAGNFIQRRTRSGGGSCQGQITIDTCYSGHYLWASAGGATVTNSTAQLNEVYGSNSYNMAGTTVYDTCVIDMLALPAPGVQNAGVFKRNGVTQLTVTNCTFLQQPGYIAGIYDSFDLTADTLTLANNSYYGNVPGIAARNLVDSGGVTASRTFAQLQALGLDAGSVQVSPFPTPVGGVDITSVFAPEPPLAPSSAVPVIVSGGGGPKRTRPGRVGGGGGDRPRVLFPGNLQGYCVRRHTTAPPLAA